MLHTSYDNFFMWKFLCKTIMEFLTKKLYEIMPILFFLNIMHFRYYVIIIHFLEKSQITIIMWVINFDFQVIIRENLKLY